MWDVVTPAYHSFDMADRIPGAELHVFELGSHFCNLEFPKECAEIAAEFLSRHGGELVEGLPTRAAESSRGRVGEEKVESSSFMQAKTLGDGSDVETESTASSADVGL